MLVACCGQTFIEGPTSVLSAAGRLVLDASTSSTTPVPLHLLHDLDVPLLVGTGQSPGVSIHGADGGRICTQGQHGICQHTGTSRLPAMNGTGIHWRRCRTSEGQICIGDPYDMQPAMAGYC
jgi:hypothetical protein